jgi:hypothetical protein
MQVANGVQVLLAVGTFSVALVPAEKIGDTRVEAAVDNVRWVLGKHLPALKAAETIYSFGLEETRSVYYCLVLPTGM